MNIWIIRTPSKDCTWKEKLKNFNYSSFLHPWPISQLVYRHFTKSYKSRWTPSTSISLMISSSEQLMDLLLALINTRFRIGQGKIVLLFVDFFFFQVDFSGPLRRFLSLTFFFPLCICTCPAWRGGRILDPGIKLVQRLKAKMSHSQPTENKYGWRWERWAADHLFCHLLLWVCACSRGVGFLALRGLLFFRA